MEIGVYIMAPPNRGHAPTDLVVGPGGSANVAATTGLRDFAVHAEGLGFDALWLPDHVVMPTSYDSKYPYQPAASGDEFVPYPFDDTPFPEPFTALAFVAGATQRLRLGTGVLILPERNPVLFAKQAATLDALSDGRLLLGIGVGWLREEFEALGVPWDRRGARMDECIDAMRALWRDDIASYHGAFVDFTDIRCDPKPVAAGGVPLIIGGHSEAAARRAGRVGDGFIPTGFAGTNDVAPLIDVMRRAADKAGRDPDSIKIYAGAAPDPAMLDDLRGRGVAHVFIAAFPSDLDHAKRWLDEVAAKVLTG